MSLADTIVAASKQGIEITFRPQWGGDQIVVVAKRGGQEESLTLVTSILEEHSVVTVIQFLREKMGPPPENSIRNIFEDLLEEERKSAGLT